MVVTIKGQTYYDTEEINQLVNLFRSFAIQWLQRNGRSSANEAPLGTGQRIKRPTFALTPREMQILTMVAEGCFNKEIASRLGLSEQTVKNHMTAIMLKLNAGSRTEAISIALRYGLISLN